MVFHYRGVGQELNDEPPPCKNHRVGATRGGLQRRPGWRKDESLRRRPSPTSTGFQRHTSDAVPSFQLMALILRASKPMQSPSVLRAPLLLTVPDTARRLRRHEQTIRAMIRRGDLAAIRLGRLVRVFAAAVDRASAAMGSPAVRPRTPRRALRRLPARARA